MRFRDSGSISCGSSRANQRAWHAQLPPGSHPFLASAG